MLRYLVRYRGQSSERSNITSEQLVSSFHDGLNYREKANVKKKTNIVLLFIFLFK